MAVKLITTEYKPVPATVNINTATATHTSSNLVAQQPTYSGTSAEYLAQQVAINIIGIETAIPTVGAYKRADSIATINSIATKNIGRPVSSSAIASTSSRTIQTSILKTSDSIPQIQVLKTFSKVLSSPQALQSTALKLVSSLKLSTQGLQSSVINQPNKLLDSSVLTQFQYSYSYQKSFTSPVVVTDDSLGEAVVDDDQTAWVYKNLYSPIITISVGTWLLNKAIDSTNLTNSLPSLNPNKLFTSPNLTNSVATQQTDLLKSSPNVANSLFQSTAQYFRDYSSQNATNSIFSSRPELVKLSTQGVQSTPIQQFDKVLGSPQAVTSNATQNVGLLKSSLNVVQSLFQTVTAFQRTELSTNATVSTPTNTFGLVKLSTQALQSILLNSFSKLIETTQGLASLPSLQPSILKSSSSGAQSTLNQINTGKVTSSTSATQEAGTAYIHNYFADLTYTADISYVGQGYDF